VILFLSPFFCCLWQSVVVRKKSNNKRLLSTFDLFSSSKKRDLKKNLLWIEKRDEENRLKTAISLKKLFHKKILNT
jgi:hypothetical protein